MGRFGKRHPSFVAFYTDPSLESYKALGLIHGMGGMASFKMIPNALRAMTRGHRQSKTQGDPLQQGGVCVVDTNGNVLFAHRDQTAGDHINAKQLLSKLSHTKQQASG